MVQRLPAGTVEELGLLAKRVLLVADLPSAALPLQESLYLAGASEVRVVTSEVAITVQTSAYDMVVRCELPAQRAMAGPAEVKQQQKKGPRYDTDDILGVSPGIEEAKRRLRQVAAVDAPVLITGETGTGKEMFAQALHGLSHRSGSPFVAVNLAALPESLLESELFGYAPGSFTGARREGHKGKFLQADGGTIFLDEIGDLPLALQAKLLRVLQEKEVDQVGSRGPVKINVRVISATHRNLPELIKEGKFRADLYYRLNVLNLHIPSLRDRPEDIQILAERFLQELAYQYHRPAPRLAFGARDRLQSHWWPGNVRELRNAMEYAFTFSEGPQILAEHLPIALYERTNSMVESRYEKKDERGEITRVLEQVHGNKAEAARRLGISRSGLYVKLRELGLN